MPLVIPSLIVAKEKIEKSFPQNSHCRSSHKLAAIAFTANGHVVSRATNRIWLGDPEKFSIHAEEFLIKKLIRIRAKERFGRLFVLVARWSPGIPGWTIAKPCENCQRLLDRYSIRGVYFTDRRGRVQRAG